MFLEGLSQLSSDYRDSFLVFTAFALFHSFCSHELFKDLFAKIVGPFFVRYLWRFIYCALSYWMLYSWFSPVNWHSQPEYQTPIINYRYDLWTVVKFLHLVGMGISYCAFLQSDYLEFLGIKQVFRGLLVLLKLRPDIPDATLFGTGRLEVKGIYRIFRHPMLAGGLLYVATMPPSVNALMLVVYILLYTLIGVYFEERRLVRVFGEQYRQYQREVGAFIPKIRIAYS